MAIRFIYFDLGNVLVHFDPEVACENIAKLLSTDAATISAAMYDSGIEVQLEAGKISEQEFLAQLFEKVGASAGESEVLEAMGNMFWLNPPMLPVVAKLMETTIPVGILSNTCAPHWNWIIRKRYGLIRAMSDRAVLSYEVGCMKPDGLIYDVAAERAGCEPGEILFVDDRIENVEAAERKGWKAFQFTSAHQFVSDLRNHGFDCFV